MSTIFRFKQFDVEQKGAAMKIGTDGILLGAWTPLDPSISSILDIGSGTGLLGLMLAQRSSVETIDAIEIDGNAYEQTVDNFEASPWNDRLFCYHASFAEFVDEIDQQYDLLISNPPFFKNTFKTNESSRNLARFQDALPFEELLAGANNLLKKEGKLFLIIPYYEEEEVVETAKKNYLFPEKITRVKGNPTAAFKRSLIFFGRKKVSFAENELFIEYERHQYSESYRELTKNFHTIF